MAVVDLDALQGELEALVTHEAEQFLEHPFIRALEAGRLTREQLQVFARQYYLQVREFPRFLSAIHANCPDQAIRDIIVGNLWEEHGGLVPTRDHPAIFRAFGRALGLSDEEMEAAEPIPEVQAFIDRHEVVAKNRPFWEGIAGVTIGLEGQVPKTFGRIITALRERYGFSDDAIEFFIVHLTADSEHSGSGFDIIRRYVSDEAQIPVIRRAVKASLDAWRLMFDGIWRVATER